MSSPSIENAVKGLSQITEHNLDGSILFAVTPAPGHVNPMLAIACHLRDKGYSVLFNTAEVFREQIESREFALFRSAGTRTLITARLISSFRRDRLSRQARKR